MTAVAEIAQVNVILIHCSIADVGSHKSTIHNEGFDTLESSGLLDGNADVTKMTKRLSGRPGN
eukprot:4533379-Ditylum_brightwellii.AAC.1